MAYTPPTSPLSFEFSAGYTPATSPLSFIFVEGSIQYVSPTGEDTLGIGDVTAYNQSQFVSPSGVDSLAIGDHVAATDQFIYHYGPGTEEFGSARLVYDQYISLSAGDTARIGATLVARQIVFNFQGSYTPSTPLDFDFLGDVIAVLPAGVDHSGFGSAFIAYENQEIRPAGVFVLGIGGFDSVYTRTITTFATAPLAVGSPTFDNADRVMLPTGAATQIIAQPEVYNETPEVRPSGIIAAAFGAHTVMSADRRINPAGVDAVGFGVPGISNNPHFIYITQALRPDLIGAAVFYGGTQTVTVINQFTESIGAASVSYANREIAVSGVSSLGITNQHLVKDSLQSVLPQGVEGSIGFATVANQDRSILVDGVRGAFGVAVVYNANQYIRMLTPFPVDPQKPGVPEVRNFDKEIRPQGVYELNVYPTHSFAAYQNRIFPGGISGAVGDARVRNNDYYHPFDGIDSLLIGNQQFRNTSFGVYASAGDTTEIGAHVVAKSLYRIVDGVSDTAVGAAWISNDPRNVSVFERGIDSLQVGGAFVATDPQYITASGVAPAPVGYQLFQVRLLTLPMTGFFVLGVGAPRVENFDKELQPYPFFPLEVGSPRLELGNRYIAVDGLATLAITAPRVSDQTQRIQCSGGVWIPIRDIVGLPMLYKVPGDPPATQTMYPQGVNRQTPTGATVVRTNSIDASGIDSAEFGSAEVRSAGIFPEGIHENFVAETFHRLVYDQKIYPAGVAPIDELSPPFHDMKHRTIWCTSDVTPQIRNNHPGNEWESVDSSLLPVPAPGTPMVQNQNRSVSAIGFVASEFGVAVVSAYSPFIRPDGVPPPRVGMPKFYWRDNIDLNEYNQGPFTEAIGEPSVGPYIAPGTQGDVRPIGIDTASITSPRISNFNQVLDLAGLSSAAFGFGQFNLPLPPFQFTGVASQQIGAAFISNFIREIRPAGIDSLDTWETVGTFSRKMRVYTTTPAGISYGAGNTAQVGTPAVGGLASFQQTIFAGDTRSLVVPGPVLGIQLDGVGSGVALATLGDIRVDLVEEGKAKAYGIPPNNIQRPQFLRAVAVPGVVGTIGNAVLGGPLLHDGVETISIGAHVFTLGNNNLHTCGMAARALAVSGASTASVPEPALT